MKIKTVKKKKNNKKRKIYGNYVINKNLFGQEIQVILLAKNIHHFIKVYQMIGKMNWVINIFL